eukprot:5864611-Alexandrium_andersonii.AAC.1
MERAEAARATAKEQPKEKCPDEVETGVPIPKRCKAAMHPPAIADVIKRMAKVEQPKPTENKPDKQDSATETPSSQPQMRRPLPSAGRISSCSRSSARRPWPAACGRRTRSRRSTRRRASARPT